MPAPFLPGLALALTIGLLIGFERGWQLRDEAAGQRVAGVRTFAMLGLLGGVAGLAAAGPTLWIALFVTGGAALALLMAHGIEMHRDGTVSATGAIAGLATLLLGAISTAGQPGLAAVAAAALVTLLSARKPLHALLRQSSEEDVKALIRLSLVAFLVLPLLPDTGLGPYGSLNPRRLWTVVVVIGAVSFFGYVLARTLKNRKGGLVAAALGALVSSTAVTVACSQAIRRGEGVANQAAIALASTIMLARTLALVAILAPLALPDVLKLIGPALLVAAAGATALIGVAMRDGAAAEAPARPPGLATALFFAALVGVVTLSAAWLEHRIGDEGGAVAVALGGMVDVDSAIAAIGMLPPSALSARIAALAIAAPVLFNTLLKLAITLGIGGWRSARWAALSLAFAALAIGASAALTLI
jgi:uncharacterized membrane protein (DUF4010 family)